MNQKRSKKLRKKLREERAAIGPLVDVKGKPITIKKNLLMRRMDLQQENHRRMYRGGAILHPLSDRAQYQSAKRKGLEE